MPDARPPFPPRALRPAARLHRHHQRQRSPTLDRRSRHAYSGRRLACTDITQWQRTPRRSTAVPPRVFRPAARLHRHHQWQRSPTLDRRSATRIPAGGSLAPTSPVAANAPTLDRPSHYAHPRRRRARSRRHVAASAPTLDRPSHQDIPAGVAPAPTSPVPRRSTAVPTTRIRGLPVRSAGRSRRRSGGACAPIVPPAETTATFSHQPDAPRPAPRRQRTKLRLDPPDAASLRIHKPPPAHRTAARHQATPVVRIAARQGVGSAARPPRGPRSRPTCCPVRSATVPTPQQRPETPPKLTPPIRSVAGREEPRSPGSLLLPSSEAVARDDQEAIASFSMRAGRHHHERAPLVAVVEHSVERGGSDRLIAQDMGRPTWRTAANAPRCSERSADPGAIADPHRPPARHQGGPTVASAQADLVLEPPTTQVTRPLPTPRRTAIGRPTRTPPTPTACLPARPNHCRLARGRAHELRPTQVGRRVPTRRRTARSADPPGPPTSPPARQLDRSGPLRPG
jgi:hypothetical protein